MSQIFPPSANNYARGSIVVLVVLVASTGLTLDRLSKSPYMTRAQTVREQPVQFSHQHHAAGLGFAKRAVTIVVGTRHWFRPGPA